ncbi:MAG: response regulator transcription factor [Bacteroidota bacterium]|nr:response regulator transcription factor [Bacteroidota bacterium]MDP4192349.1 response regulator transcription factor [Bacteroidota bacterium]
MNPRILLVDDEPDIVEFLQYNLEQEGFDVITAFNGEDALRKVKTEPDLIILDVMMPKMDGFEVCRRIREDKSRVHIPVIFLTARSGEQDEIKGLELGADDFVGKPISPKKLVARVKANLRKLETILPEDKNNSQKFSIGPLEIDRGKYEIMIDGQIVIFPRKEFEILYFLASQPGKVFSREIILKEIWGMDIFVVERTVDVHVRKIREKLDAYADLIETIKGVGYRFRVQE